MVEDDVVYETIKQTIYEAVFRGVQSETLRRVKPTNDIAIMRFFVEPLYSALSATIIDSVTVPPVSSSRDTVEERVMATADETVVARGWIGGGWG